MSDIKTGILPEILFIVVNWLNNLQHLLENKTFMKVLVAFFL